LTFNIIYNILKFIIIRLEKEKQAARSEADESRAQIEAANKAKV